MRQAFQRRQRFLAEQGYAYTIVGGEDVLAAAEQRRRQDQLGPSRQLPVGGGPLAWYRSGRGRSPLTGGAPEGRRLAATAEVVAAIAAGLADGDWQGEGIVTAEQWVALRCGVSASRARRLVALARALVDLPAAAAAFAEGARSEGQVWAWCAPTSTPPTTPR